MPPPTPTLQFESSNLHPFYQQSSQKHPLQRPSSSTTNPTSTPRKPENRTSITTYLSKKMPHLQPLITLLPTGPITLRTLTPISPSPLLLQPIYLTPPLSSEIPLTLLSISHHLQLPDHYRLLLLKPGISVDAQELNEFRNLHRDRHIPLTSVLTPIIDLENGIVVHGVNDEEDLLVELRKRYVENRREFEDFVQFLAVPREEPESTTSTEAVTGGSDVARGSGDFAGPTVGLRSRSDGERVWWAELVDRVDDLDVSDSAGSDEEEDEGNLGDSEDEDGEEEDGEVRQ